LEQQTIRNPRLVRLVVRESQAAGMQASSILGQRLQAFQPAAARQQRGAHVQTTCKDSRIGKVPVPVPDKVTVTVNGQHVVVKVRRH
jgi:hypothetical protein